MGTKLVGALLLTTFGVLTGGDVTVLSLVKALMSSDSTRLGVFGTHTLTWAGAKL